MLYVNFGEKSVAVFNFNIEEPFYPIYKGIMDVYNEGAMILPLHINYRGIMFTDNYYWSNIYQKHLK